MARTDTRAGSRLARKERVVAARDMPGVPAGTAGRVIVVEGLTWIRYWVRFENGVVRGSIDRKKLARPAEYAELVRRRELGLEDDETKAGAAGAGAASSGDGDGGDGGAPSVVVNGVSVPAHLVERSKRRREALGLA